MSSLALAQPDGSIVGGEELARPIRARIREAREHRRQFEPIWQSNMAFAAGQHWLVTTGRTARVLQHIRDVDPTYKGRELYSSDRITEFRMLALGELGGEDDRPELLLNRDDQHSEDFQVEANRAMSFGWEQEWKGDEALAMADQLAVDLGTSAVRVRFDSTAGKPKEEQWPHLNGKPLLDKEGAYEKASAAVQAGQQLEMKPLNEGRICWEPLSAFNLLAPPGVVHERYFPWEAVIRPTPLEDVRDEFGEIAGDLSEDGDIASTLGVASTGNVGSEFAAVAQGRQTRLRGHVWLITYYERPTSKNPKGRVLHFAGNDLKLLRVENELPYCAPDGVTYRSGISYFHWWRVTGRFWSRALVEALKEGQRGLNRLGSYSDEIIKKGLPYVLVPEGPQEQALKQSSVPFEVIKFPPGQGAPQPVQGIGPGPWIQQRAEEITNDLERAAGIRAASLGENPANVDTYAALAKLSEADQVKRNRIRTERKLSICQLVEDSVYDIKTYWGPDKHLMLSGDEGKIEATTFDATKIPVFYIVQPAKGTVKPRSQAAELQKVEDLWHAALNAGAVPMRPDVWLKWYADSLAAGEALDLPESPGDVHAEKAERENHQLLSGDGDAPQVSEYDPIEVHVPIHRKAQIEAEQAGDAGAWDRASEHIQDHEDAEAEKIRAQAAEQAGTVAAQTVTGGEQAAPPLEGPPPPSTSGSGPSPGMSTPSDAAAAGPMPEAGGPLPMGVPGALPSQPINVTIPMINIPPAEVSEQLPPQINVTPDIRIGSRHVEFVRDEHGMITDAIVTDADEPPALDEPMLP